MGLYYSILANKLLGHYTNNYINLQQVYAMKSLYFKELTSYPEGSLRELLQISFPLIISLMSASLMLFLDRLFLARYSLAALNAAAHAGASVQFLQFWSIATVCIAEVFVGRYNGAGKMEKLGQPVWQMIWLSLGTFLIYLPIGFWAGPLILFDEVNKDLEIQYFSILTCFIPVAALAAALSAFYIGRSKVRFVTGVMLGSNLINVLLDAILIFGIPPWIPSFGIAGAAWATAISQVCQAMILFSAFFCRSNRQLYGTGRWRIKKRLFLSCVRIGLPNAVAHSLDILTWVLIFDLMSRLGADYMTVVTIAQSILFLFTFVTEGVSKGATAIAANFIGSQKHDLVWKLLASGTKLYVGIFVLLSGLLVWQPDPLIGWFIPEETLSPTTQATVRAACFWVWIYFLFDGISWLLIGLLTAAGDTRFIMKIGGTTPLLFALLPTYLFVFKWGAPAHVTWMMIAFYAFASGAIYLWRFRSERWKELVLA
jgi:MATE family multidrug resistance protein